MVAIAKVPRGNEVLPKVLTTAMNNLLLIWVKRVENVCEAECRILTETMIYSGHKEKSASVKRI